MLNAVYDVLGIQIHRHRQNDNESALHQRPHKFFRTLVLAPEKTVALPEKPDGENGNDDSVYAVHETLRYRLDPIVQHIFGVSAEINE